MSEKEYRVISPGISPNVEWNSREAGHRYKSAVKCRLPGETAELQEREVGEWKTVEKTEPKA